ncbi:MAG: dienelactone hydrolase-related enzyme [Paracoccus sp.]|nr:MAG: dienelactone hydrolase-related enzyme [Paracoccus sp. (in: a-proteobacteria)]
MYHKWLDRWDERRGKRSDDVKQTTNLDLRSDLAFPKAETVASLAEFGALAAAAVADSPSFYGVETEAPAASWKDGWISFPSSVCTETPENNTVHAKVTAASSSDHALIVFHHWNATSRNAQLARFFTSRGLTVVEMAMPYHLERHRPGSNHADYMLSPNLGRTIQSVRQAVLDGRQLVAFLQRRGYGTVSVLGISLGSWVAGLIAAHEPKVTKAALFLTGGSLADMVWTGIATRHIRASLEGEIALCELRRAWAPLNIESYANRLARSGLEIQILLAERDTVVVPALSESLVAELDRSGAQSHVTRMNCGHYSLTLPPYVIKAGIGTAKFLNRKV